MSRNKELPIPSGPQSCSIVFSTGARPAFVVPSTHSDAIMEDFMPILIRHNDNNINVPGEVEITAFRPEKMPDSPASYTALDAIFGDITETCV